MLVQQLQQGLHRGDGGGDLLCIALRGGGADELDKGIAPGRVQSGLLPVHPTLGTKALGQACGVQYAGRVAGAEVTHDHVGLEQGQPHGAFTVLDGRHHGVGIAGQKFRRLRSAELAAGVYALKWNAHFLRSPNGLAHID